MLPEYEEMYNRRLTEFRRQFIEIKYSVNPDPKKSSMAGFKFQTQNENDYRLMPLMKLLAAADRGLCFEYHCTFCRVEAAAFEGGQFGIKWLTTVGLILFPEEVKLKSSNSLKSTDFC